MDDAANPIDSFQEYVLYLLMTLVHKAVVTVKRIVSVWLPVSAMHMYTFPYHRHIYTPSFKALNMAALYILDKLSEAAGSFLLEDKMKVVFSRARESDQAFIDVLCDLCSALRVSITKDRRLIAELETLGQRADALKPLEYMREMEH
ncbi:hypothetical protein Tco_0541392 [Tanacetum coccineum]